MLPSLNRLILRVFSILLILSSILITVTIANDTVKKQLIDSWAANGDKWKIELGCRGSGCVNAPKGDKNVDAKEKAEQAYRDAHKDIYKKDEWTDPKTGIKYEAYFKNGATTPNNIGAQIKNNSTKEGNSGGLVIKSYGAIGSSDTTIVTPNSQTPTTNTINTWGSKQIVLPQTQEARDYYTAKSQLKGNKLNTTGLVITSKGAINTDSSGNVVVDPVSYQQYITEYQAKVQQTLKDYGLPTSIDGPDLNGLVGTISNDYILSGPAITKDYSQQNNLSYNNTSDYALINFLKNSPVGGVYNAIYNPQNYRGDKDVAMSLIDNLLISDEYKNNWSNINQQVYNPNVSSFQNYANSYVTGLQTSETRNATIDYGLDVTKAIGTAIALPAIGSKLALEGGWAALNTAFQANMVINTATGTVETAQTYTNEGFSSNFKWQLAQTAVNWAFLGSVDKLNAAAKDVANSTFTANTFRAPLYNAVASGAQVGLNINDTVNSCSDGGDTANCILMLGSDALLIAGIKSNISTYNSLLSNVKQNLANGSLIAVSDALTGKITVQRPFNPDLDLTFMDRALGNTILMSPVEISNSTTSFPISKLNANLLNITPTVSQTTLAGASLANANNIPFVDIKPITADPFNIKQPDPVIDSFKIPPLNSIDSPIGANGTLTTMLEDIFNIDLEEALQTPLDKVNWLKPFTKPTTPQSPAKIARDVSNAIADDYNNQPRADIKLPKEDVPIAEPAPEPVAEPPAPIAEVSQPFLFAPAQPTNTIANILAKLQNVALTAPYTENSGGIVTIIPQNLPPSSQMLFAPNYAQNPIVRVVNTWFNQFRNPPPSAPQPPAEPSANTGGARTGTGGELKSQTQTVAEVGERAKILLTNTWNTLTTTPAWFDRYIYDGNRLFPSRSTASDSKPQTSFDPLTDTPDSMKDDGFSSPPPKTFNWNRLNNKYVFIAGVGIGAGIFDYLDNKFDWEFVDRMSLEWQRGSDVITIYTSLERCRIFGEENRAESYYSYNEGNRCELTPRKEINIDKQTNEIVPPTQTATVMPPTEIAPTPQLTYGDIVKQILKSPPQFGIDMATIGNYTLGHGKISSEFKRLLYDNYYTPSPNSFLASGTLYGNQNTGLASIHEYQKYMKDQMSKGWVLEASGQYGYHDDLASTLEGFKFFYQNSSYDHADTLLQNESSPLYSFYRDSNGNVIDKSFNPIVCESTPPCDKLNANQNRIYYFSENQLTTIKDQTNLTPEEALSSNKYIGIVATKSVNDLGRRFLLYKANPNTGQQEFVGVVLVGDYAKRPDWIGNGAVTSDVFFNNPLGFRKVDNQQWGFDLTQEIYEYFDGNGGPVTNIVAIDPDAQTVISTSP